MSPKTFYRYLEKTRDKIEWQIKSGTIRGKVNSSGELVDPITGVYYLKYGITRDIYSGVKQASRELQLDSTFQNAIIDASDNTFDSPALSVTRKALQRHLNLSTSSDTFQELFSC